MENTPQPSDDVHDQVSGVEEKPVDLMEVFSRQLEDIINTYGSACDLMEEKISILEEDEENLGREMVAKDLGVNTGMSCSPEAEHTASVLLEGLGEEASLVLESLNNLMSPEEKLEMVLRKYAELLKGQKGEQVELKLLQKRQDVLVKQRDQLHLEHSRGILARCKLESLCRELHKHNMTLKEDMLQKCQEDERKRAEISSHFQNTVVDIQAQIEQHSNRNNKLCQENSELANKLTSIIQQYEKREESFEKIFKQKNLQQQLSDAKLEEANLRLKEAEEKHKREKEYLLKEAIEKTKKCFTMKEQELQMKKQLVLYSQKFDEFQATLAKSNDVYATFKQEMEKMTKKMKKLERESNVWKIRFESCNKALTDMIEERREKGKELELFTLKIDKLETLCRALQEERKVLYEKIKEIRMQTISASGTVMDIGEEEIPELAQLPVSEPVHNPALTAEMEKLWKEQTRLQEFAASLMASTAGDMEGSDNDEEPSELTQLVPLVPVPSKPPIVKVDSITEAHSLKESKKEVSKSETMLTPEAVKNQAIQLEYKHESDQQENEPLKTEPPTEEPPKEEQSKIDPSKGAPPKVEPSNEEPSRIEPPKKLSKKELSKEELSNMEPFNEEPSKVESPKEEPPKVEPSKEEPPKVESPNVEPSKVESPKEEPPKEEPPKEEPPKVEPSRVESLKEEPPKVPTKNVANVQPIKQDTPSQKSNKPKHVDQKHTKPKEVKRVTVQSKTSKVNLSKQELHKEQDPKTESTKEAGITEVEPIKLKSRITDAPETSTAGAAKPQDIQSQEATPSANKPHPKKQGPSKKKGGAAKSVKKS